MIITKRNRLELVFYFLFVVILLFFFKIEKIIDLTTFSTVVIVSTISFIIGKLGNWLYNKVEDSVKLTNDYDSLITRYSLEPMVTYTNKSTNEIVKFPVVKSADLFDKQIVVEDDPRYEYQLPQLVIGYYGELIEAHKTSEVYNNPNIRVNQWNISNEEFIIHTGRTTYFNSLVTNRSIDYTFRKNITARELYECGPYLNSLEQSKLSNHLGFNGFVESADGYLVFIVRGTNVSIAKNTIGTSVGASMKVKYALDENREFTTKGMYHSILCEIRDELSITEDSLEITEDKQIVLISAYRDLVEGGKPQLLFYAKSRLTKDEIEKNFFEQKIANSKQFKDNSKTSNGQIKYEEYKFKSSQEQKMLYDGNRLIWFATDELLSDKTELYPDKMIINNKKYNMVPSVSASIVMLLNWFNKGKKNENN